MPADRTRSTWAQTPLSIAYHDAEWGRPVHDDRVLFECLILEGAQAGLSWETILKKRDGYRRAFAGFDPAKVARFTDERVGRLMNDAGIVRNRLKISSAVTNARAFLAIQREFGSFDRFVWSFVGGAPPVTGPHSLREIPARPRVAAKLEWRLRRASRVRALFRQRTAWAHHTGGDVIATAEEIGQMRDRFFAGATLHRHFLWRYTLVWRNMSDAETQSRRMENL